MYVIAIKAWDKDFADVWCGIDANGDLTMATQEGLPETSAAGFELAIPDQDGKSSKLIGSREFLRYYRQNHKPSDTRKSTHISTLHQRWACNLACDSWLSGILMPDLSHLLKIYARNVSLYDNYASTFHDPVLYSLYTDCRHNPESYWISLCRDVVSIQG